MANDWIWNIQFIFCFFELGYKLLASNGKLGYITPNNYFTSLAGLSLRQYFLKTKCLTRIVDFRHKKVFDAQTYTAITFASKRRMSQFCLIKLEIIKLVKNFKDGKWFSKLFETAKCKKWRLLKTAEQDNIRIIENIGTPIKNLFNIAVGIATWKMKFSLLILQMKKMVI